MIHMEINPDIKSLVSKTEFERVHDANKIQLRNPSVHSMSTVVIFIRNEWVMYCTYSSLNWFPGLLYVIPGLSVKSDAFPGYSEKYFFLRL